MNGLTRTPCAAAFLAAGLLLLLSPGTSIAQEAPPAESPAKAPAKPAQRTPKQQEVFDRMSKVDPATPHVKADADGNPQPRFLEMHEKFLARAKEGDVGLLFLGDSITAGWGKARDVWERHYGAHRPANFGIGGDTTQHVLWRIENGELDGIEPRVVVLMIGTNNTGRPAWTANRIAAGVTEIVKRVHAKLPDTKVLLLGVFPRGEQATDANGKPNPVREKVARINAIISKLDDGKKTRYLDITDRFLAADGTLPKDVMPDSLHPNAKGYQIWAESMQPLLDEMMKE